MMVPIFNTSNRTPRRPETGIKHW